MAFKSVTLKISEKWLNDFLKGQEIRSSLMDACDSSKNATESMMIKILQKVQSGQQVIELGPIEDFK